MRLLVAALLLVTAHAAMAGETVRLHAAGSLRDALSEVSSAYEAASGAEVTQVYRPSGLIRDAIAGGEPAEVFASANMDHPQALAQAGKAGPVVLFARNALCAFVKPGLEVTSETLLERMLDPSLKLGTSTPRADPAGDYAYRAFARAEAMRQGARAALEGKALNLTGGPNSAAVPAGRNAYGHVIAEGQADIFLAYCTNAGPISREQPGIRMVRLPPSLAVGADYGITVVNGAGPAAYRLAMFILAPAGQSILARHGFSAPGLVAE